jgi:transcriptional regulator with XRE-family HTH domain
MFLYRTPTIYSGLTPRPACDTNENVALPQGPFYSALGERVRRARESARFSQRRLADSVGLSRSSLANIEAGRQPIYVYALARIAAQLRTPLARLIPDIGHELEIAVAETMSHLPTDERRFLNLVLHNATSAKKEKDGSEILAREKASGRVTKTRAHHKGARIG